jgi:hypothetical protein
MESEFDLPTTALKRLKDLEELLLGPIEVREYELIMAYSDDSGELCSCPTAALATEDLARPWFRRAEGGRKCCNGPLTGLALCAFAVNGVHAGVEFAEPEARPGLKLVDPTPGVKIDEDEVLIADPGVVEKLISGVPLRVSPNSKSIKSARTESVSFRGVVGALLGSSFRKAEGEAAGQCVGGPMDDFAGRRCCREGVVGGRQGMGSSSRNRPRRVVDDPFLARDLRLAKELFLGIGRSLGMVGSADLAGVNGMDGRSTGTGGRG